MDGASAISLGNLFQCFTHPFRFSGDKFRLLHPWNLKVTKDILIFNSLVTLISRLVEQIFSIFNRSLWWGKHWARRINPQNPKTTSWNYQPIFHCLPWQWGQAFSLLEKPHYCSLVNMNFKYFLSCMCNAKKLNKASWTWVVKRVFPDCSSWMWIRKQIPVL